MLGRKHQIARLQSDFYRDQYRKVLRWSMAAVFVMFALIFTIFYLILVQAPQAYYGNTTEGKILRMPGVKSG
jgi:hypothetical protein